MQINHERKHLSVAATLILQSTFTQSQCEVGFTEEHKLFFSLSLSLSHTHTHTHTHTHSPWKQNKKSNKFEFLLTASPPARSRKSIKNMTNTFAPNNFHFSSLERLMPPPTASRCTNAEITEIVTRGFQHGLFHTRSVLKVRLWPKVKLNNEGYQWTPAVLF